ncbi:hypothetical protein SEPCBS119000_005242 [Sporothrix epigloea]|uniref:HotDog ACOT-type domain-containing protein n=1 Tax=Sporothrix epigloea TaxID=1892477 RepID=A0ABP0DWI7_9PEZI
MAAPKAIGTRLAPLFGPRARHLSKSLHFARLPSQRPRTFAVLSALRTDGVFRGLTDERLPVPWVEVLQRQRDAQNIELADTKESVHDLTPRKMRDSYHRVVLPLGRDPWLSDTYINSSGHIRLGTLLMDLDALTDLIVFKHVGEGYTVVTAGVDRIEMSHPLTEICDLEYSGMVTYAAGGSSVEITCKVARARGDDEPSRPEDLLLTCIFTMVALDPVTRKPVPIPRLVCETPAEEALFQTGATRSLARRAERKTSLLEVAPDSEESALIHRIWLQQLTYRDRNHPLRQPPNVVAMSRTQLSTAAIMQPQYRNRHQTMIFGGYHLKQTIELAFCCAASFAHARPEFVSADPCAFRSPVPVGSVLYLTATVVYTDPAVVEEDETDPKTNEDGADSANDSDGDSNSPALTRVHVRVDSKVREMEHGTARVTGQFHYTFTVPKDVRVLPHTYEEYMKYIDARRRVRASAKPRQQPPSPAKTE